MKKLPVVLLVTAALLGLTACDNITKQDVGMATGGLIGGALGSTIGKGTGQIAATVGGTMLGAIIGGSIGKTMDDVDKLKMSQALEKTPTNQSYAWKNPDNGNSYTVTPTNTMTTSSGQPCREYTTTAVIGGRTEQIYGKACRDAGGNWRIVSS